MSRRLQALVAAGLALLVAGTAGCNLDTKALAPRPALGGARPGGALTVAISPPATLDPSNAFDPAGALVSSLVCEPLLQLDPVSGDLKPGIVRSWITSDRGTRFTLRLRGGVRFQDGTKVTAKDVAESLDRVASRENASFLARDLTLVQGFATVHGDVETKNDNARRHLGGVKVLSANSLEIRLAASDADFIRVLAQPLAAPVSRKAVSADADAFARRPVCAGPYALAAPYKSGDAEIRLNRFAGYYAKDDTYTRGGSGYADFVTFRVFPKPADAVAAYQAGQIDVTQVPAADLATATAAAVTGQLLHAPNGSVLYLGLATGKGAPFSDAALRLALSKAVDRGAVRAAAGGADLPATGFLPPNVGPTFRTKGCGTNAPATPTAGSPQGLPGRAGIDSLVSPVAFAFNDEFGNGAIAANLADQLAKAPKIRTSLAPMPWEEYSATGEGSPPFNGLFLESWKASYVAGDPYLYPLFHSNGVGQDNWSHFSDPTFDRLIAREAREVGDETARRLEYRRVEDYLCRSMPMIPLLFRQNHFLVRTDRLGSAIPSFTERATGQPALRELFHR
jgi:ABC-type transport system substrate-binding protein